VALDSFIIYSYFYVLVRYTPGDTAFRPSHYYYGYYSYYERKYNLRSSPQLFNNFLKKVNIKLGYPSAQFDKSSCEPISDRFWFRNGAVVLPGRG
jgi:hypothetical protein